MGNASIDLGGRFTLRAPERDIEVPISLPGDVHTALLEANEIPDPYFGQNEDVVAWVYKTPWTVERRITVSEDMARGHLTLTL